MRPDIVPGAVFPDYELPDHTGTLGPPISRRPLARSAHRDEQDPLRLGSEHPGLREGWNGGAFSPFHGWNNRAGAQAAAVGRKEER